MNAPMENRNRGKNSVSDRKPQTELATLVFTDIARSTDLKQTLGDQKGTALIQQHQTIVREILAAFSEGVEVETAGDSFFLKFSRPSSAVRFALSLQARFRLWNREMAVPVAIRIGIHMGEVVAESRKDGRPGKGLSGLHVDTCARVMSLAQAGQILLTRGVFDNARQALKGVEELNPLVWLNHGHFLLQGIEESQEICEVAETGWERPAPLKSSEKARSCNPADAELVPGWRPGLEQKVPGTKWILRDKLGEGGFGEVWLGEHEKLKEKRVFKFCFRAERVRALKREVTLFRLLKDKVGEHPHIVSLRDVSLDEPPFYVEMEYVEGKDLPSWCKAHGGIEAIPLETRLEIVAQIAEALQAAHQAGVIHRDVKPGNILISSKGSGKGEVTAPQPAGIRAKLSDFGIGQVLSEAYLQGITREAATALVSGTGSPHSGTMLYLAPELVAGKPASTRSDLYSLGVVLYQFLIGDFSRPLASDWEQDVADPLLKQDLQHCVTGHLEERFGGAAELAKRLRSLPARRADLARREEIERMAHRRRLALWIAAGSTAVLALLALALGYGLDQAKRREFEARQNAYCADMKAAQMALEKENRAQALALLRRHAPPAGAKKSRESDLRGVEWRYLWQLAKSDELRRFNHGSLIDGLALSPDGQWLLTSGLDQTVRLWEVKNGKQTLAFPGFRHRFVLSQNVAFGTGGMFAFVTTNGTSIRLLPEGKDVTYLTGVFGPICFSRDGQQFAGVQSDSLVLFRTGTWQSRTAMDRASSFWANVQFSANGDQFYWVNRSHPGVSVRESDTGAESRLLTGIEQLASLAISPDGKLAACGNWGGQIQVWDLATGQPLTRWKAHRGLVFGLAFSPDGTTLASGGNDQLIRLWNCDGWEPAGTIAGPENEIWGLAYSTDGDFLFCSSKDGAVRQFAAKAAPGSALEIVLTDSQRPLGMDRTGSALWIQERPNKICLKRISTGEQIKEFQLENPDQIKTLYFDRTEWICLSMPDGELVLIDCQEGQIKKRLQLGTPLETISALSPDRTRLVGFSSVGKLDLWNLETGQPELLSSYSDFTFSAAFSPDNRLLAWTANTNFSVHVREVRGAKRQVSELKGHQWYIWGSWFSADGKRIVTGSMDSTARVWDPFTGQQLLELKSGHRSGVDLAQFAPDGTTLLTVGHDRTIRFWSLATGREMLLMENASALFVPLSVNGLNLCWLEVAPGASDIRWPDRSAHVRLKHLPALADITVEGQSSSQSAERH